MKKIFIFLSVLMLCSNVYSQWSYKYYVDEFKDKTGEPYIMYRCTNGSFSNSATAGSLLIADIVLSNSSEDDVPFINLDLYEYGNGNPVGKVIGDATYTLSIKLSDNSTESFNLNAGDNTLYLGLIDKIDRKLFLNYLRIESKPIKCVVTIDGEYSSETYNFKINPIGFSKMCSRLIKSK